MTLPSNLGVPSQEVFAQADELRKQAESQQPNQSDPNVQTGEQAVPYNRFKEVNDERKALQDQLFQMQQQREVAPVQQPVQSAQVQPPNYSELFTNEELSSYETDLVVNPGQTIQQISKTIMDRGVKQQVDALNSTWEKRFNDLQTQQAQSALPQIIDNFKRNNFGPQDAAYANAFDGMITQLAQQNPQVLSDPQTLSNIRLAAIGQVVDSGRSQRPTNNALFTEQPGSQVNGQGWNNLFGTNPTNNQTQVPREAIEAGKKLGLSEADIVAQYTAMNQSGVFR